MKKQNRGFTIVELVIVIAVIAVLAAVLIPTFSSLVKKANLSADKAAVREMNMALATDEKLNGKPSDIETCMQVLANAGYNSENWVALTKGYEVYWYQEANKMILYNASTASVEYPDEYKETWTEGGRTVNIVSAQKDKNGKEKHIQVYNGNVKKALEMDTGFDIGSATGGKTIEQLTSESGSGQGGELSSEETALQSVGAELGSNSELTSVLGITSSSDAKINYSKEITSKTASEDKTYAAMQMLSVSDTAQNLTSAGGGVAAVTNLYYIHVCEDASASAEQVSAAKKEASDMVYALFTQINEGKISNGAGIVLAPGTAIDSSDHEWVPVKTFQGYFGTGDANNPIVISGAKVTSATSYSGTIQFDGSAGKYFVTGFFGTVYGNTTIENVKFEKLTIQNPAHDYDMQTSNKAVSRNTVGIVGGVIDSPAGVTKVATNVTLRNINVASSVSIIGDATASGLVGYVGGSGDKRACYNGKLIIDNCNVAARVEGQLNLETTARFNSYSSYGPVGGLIGFTCRNVETNDNTDGDAVSGEIYTIVIKDSTFSGSVDGYEDLGAAVGNMVNGNIIFTGTNDFSKAKINEKGMSYSAKCFTGLVCGRVDASSANLIFDTIPAVNDTDYATMSYYNFGGVKNQDATLNGLTGEINTKAGTNAQKSVTGEVKAAWSTNNVKYADGDKFDTVVSIDGTTPLSTNNGSF